MVASMIATPFEALALLLTSFIRMPGNKKYVSINMINLPRLSIENGNGTSFHNEGYI